MWTKDGEWLDNRVELSELLGKTLTSVEVNENRDEIVFTCDDGTRYMMQHEQDCCESVGIDDIEGDLKDLVGSPITQAEAPSTEGIIGKSTTYDGEAFIDESFTWTFYKLATVKGYVTIKWYGSSNGYYSESVDLCKL